MYVVVLYIGREFSLAESKHEESLAYHDLSLGHKNHRLRSSSIILKPAVCNMKKTEKKIYHSIQASPTPFQKPPSKPPSPQVQY
jgi:hypothetical protein